MKPLIFIAVTAILVCCLQSGLSQVNPPFECEEEVYFSNGNGGISILAFNNPSNTVFNFPFNINAIGYNPMDNYIYAIKKPSPIEIIRIHKDGTYISLGNLGITIDPVVGCFDDGGRFYVREGGNANPAVNVIDINTMTVTTMNSGGFNAKDWSYDKATKSLYGAQGNELHIFTPPASFSTKPIIGLTAADGPVFGSSFYAKDGRLYAVNNISRNLYQIDVNTGISKFIITYTGDQGDATSCPNAYIPYPSVFAVSDTICLPQNGTIQYDVIENDTSILTTINRGSIVISQNPVFGTVTIDPVTGNIIYNRTVASFVKDSFYYQIRGLSNPALFDIGKVIVKPAVSPSFANFGPYCANGAGIVLPNISNENIAGFWLPPNVDLYNWGTQDYLFIPNDENICVDQVTIPITVNPAISPVFTVSKDYCEGESPDALENLSLNGVNGTWVPDVINSNAPGIQSYKFTSTDPNQCATDDTISITIHPNIRPNFDLNLIYCERTIADTLPLNSNENINGTWNPSTINTAILGNTAYIFTPTISGDCISNDTALVDVTAIVDPSFNLPDTLCFGANGIVLPNTSTNGISGIWTPPSIQFTLVGTSEYIFTVDRVNHQCSGDTMKKITVISPINIATNIIKCDTSLQWYSQQFEVSGGLSEYKVRLISTGNLEWISSTELVVSNIASGSGVEFEIIDRFGCKSNIMTDPHICVCAQETIWPPKDISYCKDDTIPQLQAAFELSGHNYSWTLNGAAVSDSLSFVPDQEGIYILEVTNPINNCVVAQQEFRLTENPLPTSPIVDSVFVCYGIGKGDLSAKNISNQVSIAWFDANDSLVGSSFILANVIPGKYQAIFIDKTTGCKSNTTIASVFERGPVSISTNTEICENELSDYSLDVIVSGMSSSYEMITTLFQVQRVSNYAFEIVSIKNQKEIVVTTIDEFNCTHIDTIGPKINVLPFADAGKNFVLDCTTKKGILQAIATEPVGLNFAWADAVSGLLINELQTAPIEKPGTYILTVTNSLTSCSQTDTIEVFLSDISFVGMTTDESCKGIMDGSISIDNINGVFGNFSLSINGEVTTKSKVENLAAGSYILDVKDDAGCIQKDTLLVMAGQELILKLEAFHSIFYGDSVNLNASANLLPSEIMALAWSPPTALSCLDCLAPLAYPTESTTYELTLVSDRGCEVNAQVVVELKQSYNILLPNVINPNSTNGNNRFIVPQYSFIEAIEDMRIYDRWGNLVFDQSNFQPSEIDKFWGGTFSGVEVADGVYVYQIKIKFTSGASEYFVGDITVLK